MFLQRYFESFISLFYPRLCSACDIALRGNEHILCAACLNSLPETGYHTNTDQPLMELFTGRLRLQHAMALMFFDKGSKYRNLIYQLKYKGKKESGIFLGRLLGSRINQARISDIDYIVPVPLHRSKLRRRGYNQSGVIAQGISDILNIPVLENALIRKAYTTTQTRKARYERWQNVEGIFKCRSPEALENKHILLIDDVVTTGATLEAAGACLLKIQGVSLSIGAAAFTPS